MKTRNGFVSNSSTASFTLRLPHRPETWQELHGWLYPKGPTVYASNWTPATLTSEEIARQLWDDLQYKNYVSDIERLALAGQDKPEPPAIAEVSYEDNEFFYEALMDSDFEYFVTGRERE